NLLQSRRLEGVTITALDDQIVVGFPHQVGSGTDFAAKDLMVVVASAGGKCQTMPQIDFILQEQGLVIGFIRTAGQFGVRQGFVPEFRTTRKPMLAQRSAGKTVDYLFLHVLRSRRSLSA